jgi:hypothetical protein
VKPAVQSSSGRPGLEGLAAGQSGANSAISYRIATDGATVAWKAPLAANSAVPSRRSGAASRTAGAVRG